MDSDKKARTLYDVYADKFGGLSWDDLPEAERVRWIEVTTSFLAWVASSTE